MLTAANAARRLDVRAILAADIFEEMSIRHVFLGLSRSGLALTRGSVAQSEPGSTALGSSATGPRLRWFTQVPGSSILPIVCRDLIDVLGSREQEWLHHEGSPAADFGDGGGSWACS